jgi:hypothetical protein
MEAIEDPVTAIIRSYQESKRVPIPTVSIEPSMQLLFNNRSIEDIMRDGQFTLPPAAVDVINDLTLELLISIYCQPCHNYHSLNIRNDWKSLGLDAPTCAKLYYYFDKNRNILLSTPVTNNTPSSNITFHLTDESQ